jgi:superfamily I DNA/RNA helicase
MMGPWSTRWAWVHRPVRLAPPRAPQSRLLEEALRAAGLPYAVPKGVPFWGAPEVRDVAALLRLAAHPLEAQAPDLAAALTRPLRSLGPGAHHHNAHISLF